jgi:hypothetical protein
VDERRSLRRAAAEHAVLHLLYAASGTRCSSTWGTCTRRSRSRSCGHQGTVLAQTYQDGMGRYHEYAEVSCTATRLA